MKVENHEAKQILFDFCVKLAKPEDLCGNQFKGGKGKKRESDSFPFEILACFIDVDLIFLYEKKGTKVAIKSP